MTLQNPLDIFLPTLYEEFPTLKIFPKKSVWHQRILGRILSFLTFGAQSAYTSHYTTTLGVKRIYTPSDWEQMSSREKLVILRHERVHLRQFRRYTFLGMAILYILLPLPTVFSYFRYRFEKAAYQETIRASREMFGKAYVLRNEFQDSIVRQFTSGAYGWMWPFPTQVRSWVSQTAKEE